MFSIIIPTLNNLNYLKMCINSIEKNSKYNHEIIPHVNMGTDGTVDFLKLKKLILHILITMQVYARALIKQLKSQSLIIYYTLMMIFIFVLIGTRFCKMK